uniref:Uncharacterized protein n=1 Tax=Anguilla anguilla TaxID=7936 RepID=A0A0E9T1C3_ANGAN
MVFSSVALDLVQFNCIIHNSILRIKICHIGYCNIFWAVLYRTF